MGARRTNELVLVQGAQAERVSAAARAQAALPGAVEIYYLPAAKGSSALNYAPRRHLAALRSNPFVPNAPIRARAEKPWPT